MVQDKYNAVQAMGYICRKLTRHTNIVVYGYWIYYQRYGKKYIPNIEIPLIFQNATH